MAPDRIREALRAAPFRPFVVEISGGKKVAVRHPDYTQLSPSGRTLVIFTDDQDSMEMPDVFLISNLTFATGPAGKRKPARKK
jgi:hypothetical protein